jgi:hypothetical protein
MSALQVPLTCTNASVARSPDERSDIRELTRGLIPHIASLIRLRRCESRVDELISTIKELIRIVWTNSRVPCDCARR